MATTSEKVHILATVRKPELLEAATLVFSSLRTGFPCAQLVVWANGLVDPAAEKAIHQCAVAVGGEYRPLAPTVHDVWVESLVQYSLEPF